MAATIFGPIHNVTTAARILQESDSIGALDGDSRELLLIQRKLFAIAKRNPYGPQPKHWNTGISSTRMDQQLTRIQKGIAQYGPITNFWWTPGIFDVIGGGQSIGTVNDTVNTTWLGSFNLICLLVAGTYQIPMYICGPHFIGEKWPSGQNSVAGHDADLDALDAGMRIICARFPNLITYRSNRSDLYGVVESQINLPAPGIETGPLCRPDSQKTHVNPAGHAAMYALHNQDVSISLASSYNASPAVYSGLTPPNTSSIGDDYDPATLGLGDGANVNTWNASPLSQFGSAANLVNASATKPVFHTPGDGTKIGGAPTVTFGGAAWLKSNAFGGTKGGPNSPFMTAILFKPANLATSMIWMDGLVDGGLGTQEPYIATILTSGVVEIHAGISFDTTVGVAAANWQSVIVYWSGNGLANANSYVVMNGRVNPLGNCSNDGITGRTIGASAAAGLIANGQIARITEWYSSLGPLPRWQDVQGWLTAKYGVTPQ